MSLRRAGGLLMGRRVSEGAGDRGLSGRGSEEEAARAKETGEKGDVKGDFPKLALQRLKPSLCFVALSARLKSCPFKDGKGL